MILQASKNASLGMDEQLAALGFPTQSAILQVPSEAKTNDRESCHDAASNGSPKSALIEQTQTETDAEAGRSPHVEPGGKLHITYTRPVEELQVVLQRTARIGAYRLQAPTQSLNYYAQTRRG